VTKEKAFELRDEIIEMVISKGQWITDYTERKPGVKAIKIEVSIKVDEEQ